MSQEIIYTSAPRGLKPGSRGFCTVVSTSGMAKTLAERLESLSGYRHAYPPHDPRAVNNPVNFSHLLITVGGQRYHVLSRICDAGLDYSKRSNKLAHHVALEPHEVVAALGGPAWVLADERFCETAWDGNLRHLPSGRLPRAGDRELQRCDHWAAAAGDAGWAGVLAETAFQERGRPMSVIFKATTKALPLVVEAMALLPPDLRWQVTFSTYFTKLPAGVDCRWRFLLDGAPEAKLARRNPHSPVIDLCNPLGKAKGGELVEAARTGKLVLPARPEPAVTRRAPVAPPPRPGAPAVSQPRQPDGVYDLQPTSPALPRRALLSASALGRGDVPLGDVGAYGRAPRKGRWRSLAKIVTVAVATAALLLLGVAMGLLLSGRLPFENPVVAVKPQDSGQPRKLPREQGDDQSTPPVRRATSPPMTEPPSTVSGPTATKLPSDRAAEEINTAKAQPHNPRAPDTTGEDLPAHGPTETEKTPSDPQEPPAESQNEEKKEPKEAPRPTSEERDPFEDINKRNRVLPLPKQDRSMNALLGPQELAKLFVDSTDDCRLAILGSEHVLKGGLTFEISRKDAEDETPTWKVESKSGRGIGGKKPVGSFSLKGDSLQFEWPSIPQAQSVKLRYCVLEIQVGEQTERCILTEPEEVKPAPVDLLGARHVELPLDSDRISDKDVLRLDLQFHGFPKHDAKRVEGLKVGGDKGVVWIFPPDGIEILDNRFPEIQVTFDLDERQPRLSLEAFVTLGPKQQRVTQSGLDKFSADWDSDRVESFDRDLVKIGKIVAEKQRVVNGWDETIRQHEANMKEAKKANDPVAVATFNSKIAQIRQRMKPPADRELMKANGEKARVQALRDEAEKQRKCGEALRKRLDDLKAEGTIDFRVYAEIEGQEVVLLRSEGFSSNQHGKSGNE